MTGENEFAGQPLPPPPPGQQPAASGPELRAGSAEPAEAVVLAPRPKVAVAVALMLAGSGTSITGAFVPWWRAYSFTLSGNDVFFGRSGGGYRQIHGPGHVVAALAIITALIGLTMLVVGRLLTGAILAVVVSAVSFFFSLACLAIVEDTRAFLGGGSVAAGVPVAIVGSAATLVGAVLATAKRRHETD